MREMYQSVLWLCESQVLRSFHFMRNFLCSTAAISLVFIAALYNIRLDGVVRRYAAGHESIDKILISTFIRPSGWQRMSECTRQCEAVDSLKVLLKRENQSVLMSHICVSHNSHSVVSIHIIFASSEIDTGENVLNSLKPLVWIIHIRQL